MKEKFSLRRAFGGKVWRRGGYSMLAAVIVIAIAVVINLLFGSIPESITKKDVTAQGLYSLSEQTKSLASGLEEDIQIFWIVQDGQQDASYQRLLERYDDLSDKITLTKIDPVAYPTFASQYTDGQVYNNDVVVVCGDKDRYVSINDVYVTDYTNYSTTGETSTTFNGEGELTSAIDYVTTSEMPVIYTLSGHGEAALPTYLQEAVKRANLTVSDLSLLTSEYVPEDCSCLLVISPATDISTDDAAKLSDYLQRGGSMLLVTDCIEEKLTNLAALMSDYGVASEEGIVVEGDKSRCLWDYSYYIIPELGDHEITAPLTEAGYSTLMPVAQGLSVSDQLREGLSVTKLMTTSDSAFSKTAGYGMTTYEYEDGDIMGPFALGVAITDDAVDQGQTKIVWYSTSQMLQQDVSEIVSGANEDMFINSVEWMCGGQSGSDITIHAKTIDNSYLTVSTAAKTQLTLALVIALPAALLITGLVIWLGRRRKA